MWLAPWSWSFSNNMSTATLQIMGSQIDSCGHLLRLLTRIECVRIMWAFILWNMTPIDLCSWSQVLPVLKESMTRIYYPKLYKKAKYIFNRRPVDAFPYLEPCMVTAWSWLSLVIFFRTGWHHVLWNFTSGGEETNRSVGFCKIVWLIRTLERYHNPSRLPLDGTLPSARYLRNVAST
mgnify:CR=1 FL=1